MTSFALIGADRIVASPLAFKYRLRIGEQAFSVLSKKEHLHSVLLAGGGAAVGAGAMGSSLVASSFFAPTGIAAWLGLATAATPIGWVLAAALVTSGSFVTLGKLAADKKTHTELIPKYINTPLDALAHGLMELMGGLAVRVALTDGEFHSAERAAIIDVLCSDWGYDREYVDTAISALEHEAKLHPVSETATRLAAFYNDNPDCNAAEMQHDLMEFVQEVVNADGALKPQEEVALRDIRMALMAAQEGKKLGWGRLLFKQPASSSDSVAFTK
ncbi:hypothetical protein GRI38_13835 [Altererythrobacter aurantiacus]|uniref:Co-chaperone DjlA N-terminal domain-containing protein n=1 Tax=Parapontixanthobacter aurantiacus TaxID=1463599 RepID=A0A844ZN84_9SPHN|nr:TerB family tellurite resistance protein [Parapontixanthobacter aurantiacus]MXO87109.1 hypothetical protein [Parapontixanthobacter aurantiacus]